MSQRAKRFPANFPVVLRKGPEMFMATLCNVSIGGGCIVCNHDMEKGETAILDYETGQTRATVMWSTGHMVGLKFESTMSTLSLNCIKTESSMAS